MKSLSIILILCLSFNVFSQDISLNDTPQLQTKATFTKEVYADQITLSITLSEADTNGKVSVEELEKRMQNVLLNNGIDLKEQLTLTNMASNFRDYFLKKTDVQKIKTYELVLFDALVAGRVFKGLEKEDISNVRLLKTEYSKLEELKIELKGRAVEKAKRQAEEMLKPLKQELGSAIFISDLQTQIYPMMRSANIGANVLQASMNDSALDVNFDKIKVEATVTVYFSLN